MRVIFGAAVAGATLLASVLVTSVTHAADIVDTAVKAGQFKTLVAAVKAAGLVPTLKSRGPFTLFAPTDAAFARLPKGTVQSLLRPENKAKLRSILTYHVVAARLSAQQITSSPKKRFRVKSEQGSSLRVDLTSGVRVSGARVTRTDINTSNGVIHVVDSVLLPPARKARH